MEGEAGEEKAGGKRHPGQGLGQSLDGPQTSSGLMMMASGQVWPGRVGRVLHHSPIFSASYAEGITRDPGPAWLLRADNTPARGERGDTCSALLGADRGAE